MISRLKLADWTREDANLAADRSLVVLPVGAIEQHGPHLPLATDALLAEHIAYAATEGLSDVVVAPVFSYGCSAHHLPYGATASLGTTTLLAVLSDLSISLLDSGFAGVFILNGHGGNAEVVQLTARDTALKKQAFVAGGSYFEIAASRLREAEGIQAGELPGHAGAFETALMMAAYPDLVRPRPVPQQTRPESGWPRTLHYRLGAPGPFRSPHGYSDDPGAASVELGRDLLLHCTEGVREAIRGFQDVVNASRGPGSES